MLEVHPPHRPTHTWKDFFIHIATIAVGLLIAIGLEQTVEYFHHRHQLRDLNEQLHEALQNNLRLEPAASATWRIFAHTMSSSQPPSMPVLRGTRWQRSPG